MKLLLLALIILVSLRTTAQTFQLENLTYGKKDSKVVFAGENFFRVISNKSFSGLEYDKNLADIELRNDSLIIHVIYSVNMKDRKSNWDGKDELQVAFLINNRDRIYVSFFYKKLPHAFASISALPERSKVDKASIINSKRVEISVTAPDPEGFFTNYKVQKFELVLNHKTFPSKGDELSNEALAALAGTKTGDTLTLQNVDTFDDVTKKKLRFMQTIYFVK